MQEEISKGRKSFRALAKKYGIGQDCTICLEDAQKTFQKMKKANKKK